MKDTIKIDLPIRIEKRYIISSPRHFLDRISPHVERKRFSNNKHVQTIYLNNDEHAMPFGFSIKARRYLLSFPAIHILDNKLCFLDLKREAGEYKHKIRLKVTLRQALKIVNELYSFSETPLRPYILVEYIRQHYTPKNIKNIRLTLDTNIKYFFFPPNQKEAVEIGKENDYAILEIKEGKPNESFSIWMKEILKEINALPVISKKFTAYNLLGLHHIKTSGKPLYKECSGYEIESKLETDTEEDFQRIKQFFIDGHSDFKLPSHFPYTFESASINRYYKDNKGVFKAIFRGSKANLVRKGDVEIIKDKFGLNCIIKRKEVKGDTVPIDSKIITSAQLQGELLRLKKVFWINNPQTHRSYHISLDCCYGTPGVLYEIEIEYIGRQINSETNEEEITDDITKLTKLLIEKFPSLKPSQLTKQDWLGIE